MISTSFFFKENDVTSSTFLIVCVLSQYTCNIPLHVTLIAVRMVPWNTCPVSSLLLSSSVGSRHGWAQTQREENCLLPFFPLLPSYLHFLRDGNAHTSTGLSLLPSFYIVSASKKKKNWRLLFYLASFAVSSSSASFVGGERRATFKTRTTARKPSISGAHRARFYFPPPPKKIRY